MDRAGVVIVGGGHAGFALATSLRRQGYPDSVTLLTEEDALPYQRPPLSKAYLASKIGDHRLAFRPSEFYERKRIDLRCGSTVEWIDRRARTAVLSSGEPIRYRQLILATGSLPLTAGLRGLELDGAFQLHSRADADALRTRLPIAGKVAVVGGGFIGLEFAAYARSEGKQVTIVDGADRLMARAVSPAVSEFFRNEHVSWGSRVLLNTIVERLVARQFPRARR